MPVRNERQRHRSPHPDRRACKRLNFSSLPPLSFHCLHFTVIDQLTCQAGVKSLLTGRTISVYRCVINRSISNPELIMVKTIAVRNRQGSLSAFSCLVVPRIFRGSPNICIYDRKTAEVPRSERFVDELRNHVEVSRWSRAAYPCRGKMLFAPRRLCSQTVIRCAQKTSSHTRLALRNIWDAGRVSPVEEKNR